MLIILTLITYPYLIVMVVVLFFFMLLIRKCSLTATMDSLRFDAITRSPINSLFSASLHGLITIRAYQKQSYFKTKFLKLVDDNGAAYFSYQSSVRWMAYYLDYISTFFILSTVGIALYLKNEGIEPALVALGITSAMGLSGPFQFLIRASADVTNSMTSVQRMQEYSELPSEAPPVQPADKALSNWPNRGAINFKNVVMRYRANYQPVLRHISFRVEAGMKVGIVGRTGSGKSSILQALFRLTECDAGSEISIDNVNIAKLGLKLLRSSISIIPQSPFIFEGTVRENLDPFKQHSDQAIWNALTDVQLQETIRSLENQLQQHIS